MTHRGIRRFFRHYLKMRFVKDLSCFTSAPAKLSVMALSYILIFSVCLWGTDCAVSLNYTEVQKLGNSCPQLDSCGHQRTSGSRELYTIKERNCACDYLCVEYGDCCIDAPGNTARSTSSEYSCYELKQFGGVYMKDACLPTYDGPDEVRFLCEATELGDLSDPLGSIPVTDSVTGLTYKNYYCSICNGNTDNIVLWTPRLECPTVTLFDGSKNITQEYVFENLASVGSSWGLYLAGENGSLFFHDCEIDPVMPLLLESKIRLCKPDLISDCPPDWKDEDARTMCTSYMGTRFIHGGDKFRNAHCALCNGMNVTHLSCQSAELRGMVFFRHFESHAFALLLDINERRGEDVGLIQMCESGEVFDPFFKICRSLTCLPGYIRQEKECVPKSEPGEPSSISNSGEGPVLSMSPGVSDINTDKNRYSTFIQYRPVLDASENVEPHHQNITGVSYNLTSMDVDNIKEEIAKFQNCLLISLTDEDYVMLPNKSIYVPRYDKIYEPTSYHSADGSVLVCSHFVSKSIKFMPLMGYLTIAGLGVSMVCLFLHFVAFWIVPDLQNLSGKSLVSQCVSLFFAYFCFIIGLLDSLGYSACSTIAFLTFYFFQVSFFWMGVMAYDVWRTLKMATTELRVSNGKQLRRFISYCFFAWITPCFIVIVMAFAEYTDAFPLLYRPDFANPRCWFKRRRALLVFFAAPLIAILVSNVVFFVSSSRMILVTTQTAVKQQNQTNRRNFKLYLRLALLMGLTWIIGIVAGYVDKEILWYLFVLFNTLQGLFIFVAFTCSTKVVNFIREKIRKNSHPRDSSHSASTGSGCHTSSTNLHPNLAKKFSSKLLLKKKDSASTTSSSSINAARQNNSPL